MKKGEALDEYLDYCYDELLIGEGINPEHLKGKEKRKERREKRKSEGGGKLGNFFKKIGEGVKKVGKIALLAPFYPMMIAVLKKKNIKPKKAGEGLARQFFDEVIQKKNYESENFDPVTISIIVSSILTWIKSLRDKKKSGQQLSETEEKALSVAEYAGEAITGAVRDIGEEKTGEFIFSALPIIAVVALVFFLRRK
jgi:hypothetical protein